MSKATTPGRADGQWIRRAFWILLVAWVGLGAAHTGGSYLNNGLRPSEPPAIGAPVEDWGDDVRAVRELLVERSGRRVFIQLAPSADTIRVLYLRYQLAHLLYPREVYGGRAPPDTGPPPTARTYDLLVTGPGATPPPGRSREGSRGGYTLWVETRP